MSRLNLMNNLFMTLKDSIFSFSEITNDRALYRDLVSDSKPKYDDDVMECLQFGICDINPKLKEIPYFHF